MLKRILNNQRCAWALFFLAVFYLIAIFADFIAPYRYDEDDLNRIWAPPARIGLIDIHQGAAGPFVYGQVYKVNEYYQRIYAENKDNIYPIRFLARGFSYKVLGIFSCDIHLFGAEGEKVMLLGADSQGRDIFSRIVYGSRASLFIALIGALLALAIGMVAGGIAGYCGGFIDNIIMRFCEMLMMAPAFYLILAMRGAFPSGLSSIQVYLLIVIVLSFIGWASTARVIRGMAISLRENDFILSARALGVSRGAIIMRHILPHTFPYAITTLCLSVPGYILGEAALSMLGLGVQEPQASLGNLLSMAMGVASIRLYPWVLAPGIFIIAAVVCFNMLGEALQEEFDVKSK